MKRLATALVVLSFLAGASVEAASITIAWDPNPEPDVAGYVVSYGFAPGMYVDAVDVGPATTWTLRNAEAGRTYFFSVRAYNWFREYSPPSGEVAAIGQSSPPFGVIDTPVQGATGISGSIAVSGWAMDNDAVQRVAIFRDPTEREAAGNLIFVGNAVMVEGARPDVEAAFPGWPGNTRAGWGYLLLTNMLPNRGDGTYRLHAYAIDGDGLQTLLGSRTITCTNSTSPHPFGGIDTPAPGETVFGTVYNNFGWVLSRGLRRADPAGGGTVRVVIDGVPVGTPSGWTSRSDLSAAFPLSEYSGISTAMGVFPFDTTQLADGIHTIAWSVIDNQQPANAAGIGSRYFSVANSALHGVTAPVMSAPSVAAEAAVSSNEIATAPLERDPVLARRGFAMQVPFRRIGPGPGGVFVIQSEELDRLEVRLTGDNIGTAPDGSFAGYLRTESGLRPLPIGSQLDERAGTFTWQPGAGFVGTYDFVFVRRGSGRAAARHVRVVLNPKSSGRVGPQVTVDVPAAHATVGEPFVVAGWALDLDSDVGTGVETVHVWAYPSDDAAPVFLGAAAMKGRRPDVAAVHGTRFRDSGFGLVVRGLAPGEYRLAVFAWSIPLGGWAPARTVRVTVR